MSPNTCLRPVFLAGIFALAGTSHSFAIEAQQVGERLKELLDRQQVELTYESAELTGDDVTLRGASVKSTAADGSVDLGEIVLQDVTEEQDGSYRVGVMELDTFQHQAGDITFAMDELVITGLVLPRDAASDPFGGLMRYDRIDVARINVDGGDGPLASVSDLYALTEISSDNTMNMEGAVGSFSLDLASLVEEEQGAAKLEELGYDELSGRAVMEGSWNPSDGRMIISRQDIVVDDAGTLGIKLDLAGYTPEFIRAIEETTKAMEAQNDDEAGAMQGMAVLGLMQQLTFHGATIRFTDDSLTNKLLQEFSGQQGSSPSDLIALAKAVIPPQITPFVGAEFAATVGQTVGTFLENPGNIELSAQPEKPMPFSMLMVAMGAPEMVSKQLGLTIKANQ